MSALEDYKKLEEAYEAENAEELENKLIIAGVDMLLDAVEQLCLDMDGHILAENSYIKIAATEIKERLED